MTAAKASASPAARTSQGPESAQWDVHASEAEAAQIAEPRVRHDTDNFLTDRRRLASALIGATNG